MLSIVLASLSVVLLVVTMFFILKFFNTSPFNTRLFESILISLIFLNLIGISVFRIDPIITHSVLRGLVINKGLAFFFSVFFLLFTYTSSLILKGDVFQPVGLMRCYSVTMALAILAFLGFRLFDFKIVLSRVIGG